MVAQVTLTHSVTVQICTRHQFNFVFRCILSQIIVFILKFVMDNTYKDININKLKIIVSKSDSFVETTIKLGFNPKKGNIKKNIERLIKRNNISTEHFSSVQRLKKSKKNYDKDVLIDLVRKSTTLKEILSELDLLPIESNYTTLKKYLNLYNIDYSYFRKTNNSNNINPNYSEKYFKEIIMNSFSFREVFQKLGLNIHGNNYKTIHKYIKKYNIDISHFNANKIRSEKLRKFNTIPLNKILIENSTYVHTTNLKNKLYKKGLKERKCEMCGQDEWWCDKKMSLIIDHINGINNDNRIENLRIVCPNCNATLSTHCGKNKKYKN